MAAPSCVLDNPSATQFIAAGTTPTLYFTGSDTDGGSLTYEVQVDTSVGFNSVASHYATPAMVQEKTIVDATATPGAATMDAAFTAGNLVVVAVTHSSITSGIVSGVTDGAGNNYIRILESIGGGSTLTLFYAWGVKATTTVNVAFNDTANDISAIIREYSGIENTSNPLDKSTSATGLSTAPNSGATAATTLADELVIGAVSDNFGAAQTVTAGSGYGNLTSVLNSSSWNISVEDKVVTSTGAQTAAFTLGTSTFWACAVITFKAKLIPDGPILDKFSASDAGFTGSPDSTDPFTAGQQVNFTVQAGDALTNGATYYWRARANDGITWGAWSMPAPLGWFRA